MDNNVDKKILVLATMSAGKSTLINALIGHDIFPSSNEACTAKIMTYTADQRIQNIKAKLSEYHNQTYENVKKQDITLFNSNSELKKVDFYGPINSCLNNDVKVKFIDSPGVNNSQDKTHEEITYDALEKEDFDTILYILNATQLGVDDDALLLGKLKGYIKRNKHIDIVFVLNKIDEIDTEKESLNDLYKNAIKYISNNTDIANPKIVCTSGYYANIIKKKNRNEKLTRKEIRCIDFFDNDYDEEYSRFNNLIQLNGINVDTDEKCLLNKTGILNLENYLFDGINRKKMYMNIYSKLEEIKKIKKDIQHNNIENLVQNLKNNNLLENDIKPLSEYLKRVSLLNSNDAKILLNILNKYKENPVIFAIVKSLEYAVNDEKQKRFMKFDKVIREVEQDIDINENINTEEILDFIIEEIKYEKENEYKSIDNDDISNENKEKLKSSLVQIIKMHTENEKLKSISSEIENDKMNIEEDKFTVVYRKTVAKCSNNTTIIKPNGSVRMLSGSDYEKESIPKFDAPIVDIDDRIALDECGRVYQWGQFCESIPSNLPKVKQVVSCSNIKIALDEFGVIHKWGKVLFKDPFKNMPQINSKIIQIVSKNSGVMALDENGKVYCWGFSDNSKVYNIPKNLPHIKKVQIVNGESAFALDKDGKVHFWGEIENDINIPHMLPMIVDITVSNVGEYCLGLDNEGKIHKLNNVSLSQSSIYKMIPIKEKLKYLTPYGGIDEYGNLHKYIDTILNLFEDYSGVKVKIPTE